MIRIFVAILLLLFALPALAQDSGDEENGAIVRFIERQLSTPDRQIRLSGIEGLLSSNAKIGAITIADREGEWLRIENAEIVWSRLALLRGRLDIDRLSAEGIDVSRKPLPSRSMPAPESGGFRLPDLPVAVQIDEFDVARARFAPELFGLASEVSARGSVSLEDGSLDAKIGVDRLDGPGGRLDLTASFVQETEQLDIDLSLQEPENGILASLLNIEQRPPVSLSIAGSGPLGELDVQMAFDAGGRRILTGTTQLRRGDEGLRFAASLSGPISEILPETYRPFFGPQTSLAADGLVLQSGGLRIDRFDLEGAQLAVNATAETAGGFLRKLALRGQISDGQGGRVLLPVPGGQTSVRSARIDIDFGDGDRWTAEIDAVDLSGEKLRADRLMFEAGGVAEALGDPDRRHISFAGGGALSGIAAEDPDIAEALGSAVDLRIDGDWRAGQPLTLASLTVKARELLVSLAGSVADMVFSGEFKLDAGDLAPLSGLAGQQIGGSAQLTASGDVLFLTGGFDLDLNGSATDLRLENASLNGLLRGNTTIEGRLARNEKGFETRDLRIRGERFRAGADGTFATGAADFDFDAVIDDLQVLSDRVAGELRASGYARGADGQIGLSANLAVDRGELLGKPLSDATLAFSGSRAGGDIVGQLTGGAGLGGVPVELRTGIELRGGTRSLDGLNFTAGGARITGAISQDGDGLVAGNLDVEAEDISTLAALFLQKATGAVNAAVALEADSGRQNASIDATISGVSLDTLRIGNAKLDVEMEDLFGSPVASGTMTATDLDAAGIAVSTLRATADRTGEATAIAATATLADGGDISLKGRMAPVGEGFGVDLDEIRLTRQDVAARLLEPTRITILDGNVRIEPLRLGIGDGRLSVSGAVGDQLDLDIGIDRLPIATANAVRPDLGLGGTIDGSARISGTRDKPSVRFDLRASNITAAALSSAGIGSLSAKASGDTGPGGLSLNAEVSSPEGLRVTAAGTVPLRANGTIDLRARGQAPLSLANRFIAERGAQTDGTVDFNFSIGGSLDKPVFDGDYSIRDAQFVDPETKLRLRNINVDGRISRESVTITSASGAFADGGTVSASGSIALGPDFPANLEIRLDDAHYVDADLVTAVLDGRLTVSGPLTRDPLVSGSIVVERAEIVVPESFGSGAADIDVRHRDPPPAVLATIARARGRAGGIPTPTPRPSVARLDITIDAPRRIFVRGRGLDVEVGGNLRISGPVTDIRPVGGFNLVRGRLSILGERIVFDEGSVQLVGSLDPVLRFIARDTRSDITVIIAVTGRASNPQIALSSQPELPEDEVLARLIFNRGLSELSPLQIARLAAAAAELAGSGTSLTGKLRKATGLDDFDVYTTAEGDTAVRAGRYVRDNVYLGVEADSRGGTRGTVNLDITENLKAKGALGTDGSSIGLFFERDY